jgi:hypothetical protein
LGEGTLEAGLVGSGVEGVDVNVVEAIDVEFSLETSGRAD